MRIPTFLFLLLSSSILSGQITKADYYNKIDNKIYAYNKNTDLSFDSIVSFVNRNFLLNEDKVRAYYSWIAVNITYDLEYLDQLIQLKKTNQHSNPGSQDPDTVFLKKKAVCEGYCLLFNKFCQASSIPSYTVGGYSKMPDGIIYTEIMHSWNIVKPDSSWKLLDVTWSGGYVNAKNQFVRRFSDKYFFTVPEEFVKDHFPVDPVWQLLNTPVTKNKFFKITDTTTVTPPCFNFNDSISAYTKLSDKDKKIHDCIRYYLAEPWNSAFKRDMDIIVNNTVVDYFQEATLHFDEYRDYEKKKMGKYPTATACKKGKALLEVSRKDMVKIIEYLSTKTALTPEYTAIFKEMTDSANKNLVSIKQNTDAINAYMKNMHYK